MTARGVGTIIGIVTGTGVLVLVIVICWLKRRAEWHSDESGTWRDPLRYSIDTDLIDA
jgi:tartrate dehydratase alpha subunit/fumarate hydratase class I-like protein